MKKTIETLGGNPSNPFQIFPEVADLYAGVIEKLKGATKEHRASYAEWQTANSALASKLEQFLTRTLPALDFSAIETKPNGATRDASGAVLSYFADHVENMIVASADLSNSDRTDKFLKKTTSFKRHDFSGAFLQAGVSELTMAALCTGMALHGGVIPVCATFFVFSDFMKPSIRLAALMEQPVIFVWTHDAFRVGEDGPTHQPIEQEAQLRLLEQLQNHSHRNSLLALRPADRFEAVVAWEMALNNENTPTGLIFSRQGIQDLPESSITEAEQVKKGAYIVNGSDDDPDVILVANGSEVSTLVGAASLLREHRKLKVRIVSAPSEGTFNNQDAAYQAAVLPEDVPTFGLTAGLPVTLRGLVGPKGTVFGMKHFGYSAPYKVLDEKFGFTAEKVYDQVVQFLG